MVMLFGKENSFLTVFFTLSFFGSSKVFRDVANEKWVFFLVMLMAFNDDIELNKNIYKKAHKKLFSSTIGKNMMKMPRLISKILHRHELWYFLE